MLRPAKGTRAAPSAIALGGALLAVGNVASADDSLYEFDDRLLMGSTLSTGNLQRFNRGDQADPGIYLVDVYVNDAYVERAELQFPRCG